MSELSREWGAFQPLAWIATTPINQKRFLPLAQASQGILWSSPHLQPHAHACIYTQSLREHLAHIWSQNRAIILGLTLGAVVRLIAPLLRDKYADPIVLCIPEAGEYVITVCGGHQHQGDTLCQLIANLLGMQAVITDAATAHAMPGVDTWGSTWGWQKGAGNWTEMAGAILRDEPVQIIQESGTTLWRQTIREKSNFICREQPDLPGKNIWITHREIRPLSHPSVIWHPRVLWVGIGCERGTSSEKIDQAIQRVFAQHQLSLKSIAGIASLDMKQDEMGLITLTQSQGWPLVTFSAAQLRTIPVPNPSAIVAQTVGTASVAEASAICAAQGELIVPKQVLGPVTVAVALAPREWLNRSGHIDLVGIGPGDSAHLTPAARNAITQADVVIGYTLYLQLLDSIQRPGQIWEPYPIGAETERAQRAIDLAHWGLRVAVVSSGDCGIYGMAGVVIELLQKQGHTQLQSRVHLIPGISALQAAASRVGVPLMQDFCAISLSDLHVPWEVISQRLTHAAQGDWVTVFYNPCSRQRTWQLPAAQTIFLQYRHPKTPVAIVRQAYRHDEQIWLDDLEHFRQNPIDMFCTIIIGNSRTYRSAYGLITPRHYPPESPHSARQTRN
ncbi:MAG: precorrin-3B C(17)-methyltransferase [Gloeomargarita sp. DG02_4_bins_56]